jgi:hypothetical protein
MVPEIGTLVWGDETPTAPNWIRSRFHRPGVGSCQLRLRARVLVPLLSGKSAL